MPRHLNSYISVKTYDTSEPLVGVIQDSRKPRVTEIAALDRIAFGEPIPATDTIGEALRAGQHLCPRCVKFKEDKHFAVWTDKKTNKKYRKRLCNQCRKQLEKARHYSELQGFPDTETVQLYPTRFD